jgi:hypothetical protein
MDEDRSPHRSTSFHPHRNPHRVNRPRRHSHRILRSIRRLTPALLNHNMCDASRSRHDKLHYAVKVLRLAIAN